MSTFFVSDTHLDDATPSQTERFTAFLRTVHGAHGLYVLGDLFEAWVGDDDPSETGARVAESLAGVAASGTPVYYLHGNRDFLLGRDYADRCRMHLLPDPSVILLDGKPVHVGHGDLLCSDDTSYQQFRAMTRNPAWRAQFLAQPLPARLAFAQQAREASKARYGELKAQGTQETITDVTPATVRATFARFGVDTLIHGHTHRPAIHEDEGRTRVVLGDWYGRATIAEARHGKVRLVEID